MSDVAEEAGLSMGGLYRYFENKTTLFEALIGDIHEELYSSSRARAADFTQRPFDALLEANAGYLSHYYDNRDVMRAFIEAANTDVAFRQIWWDMRARHVERFARVLRERLGVDELDGIDVDVAADAMACMVEQCAFVWYAHEAMAKTAVPVETAALITTRAWYRTFFGTADDGELAPADAHAFLADRPRDPAAAEPAA